MVGNLGIFMLKAFFVLTSLCIHAHQEQGLSIKCVDLQNLPPIALFKQVPGNLGKLSLPHTPYSLDFGSCFSSNLLKFRPKYCFKKILHEEK